MGPHSETGRMYLLLLFISAAFGRPSSAELKSGVNQLNSLTDFTKDVGKMWNNSRLFGTVSEGLEEAEQNILEMEAELNILQFEIEQLQNEENHFPEFNEAKSLLRKTRQELRNLAERTLSDERSLTLVLDGIDESPTTATQVTLLKIAIANMEDLMIETKERLEEARVIYNKAHEAFDNLIFSVAKQKRIVDDAVKFMNAKYLEDKEFTKTVRRNCLIAAVFTLGLCSLIHHFENEVPLKESRAKLADLQSKSGRLLRKTRILNQDIGGAIGVITGEIDLITEWAANAKAVSDDIELYPEDYLVKFQGIKIVFKSGLVDLKDIAIKFLDKTKQ